MRRNNVERKYPTGLKDKTAQLRDVIPSLHGKTETDPSGNLVHYAAPKLSEVSYLVFHRASQSPLSLATSLKFAPLQGLVLGKVNGHIHGLEYAGRVMSEKQQKITRQLHAIRTMR